ncbi:MAG TPA: hypothetical protein VMX33_00820 [bacterium]|nr:hypothetical protein [bacterium]
MAALAHVGVGLALKWAAPKAPVIALVVAAETLDLMMIPLLAALANTDAMSLTHGLFMAGVWSIAAVLLAALLRCDARTSLVLGAAVFSHWILDLITHPMGAVFGGSPLPPDLPLLFAGSPRVGLGLYNYSYPLAIGFDLGLTVAGVVAYVAFRRQRTP